MIRIDTTDFNKIDYKELFAIAKIFMKGR